MDEFKRPRPCFRLLSLLRWKLLFILRSTAEAMMTPLATPPETRRHRSQLRHRLDDTTTRQHVRNSTKDSVSASGSGINGFNDDDHDHNNSMGSPFRFHIGTSRKGVLSRNFLLPEISGRPQQEEEDFCDDGRGSNNNNGGGDDDSKDDVDDNASDRKDEEIGESEDRDGWNNNFSQVLQRGRLRASPHAEKATMTALSGHTGMADVRDNGRGSNDNI